jgi:hypothetical protein
LEKDPAGYRRPALSFLSSLKAERIARKIYRSRDEARANVVGYIERFFRVVSQELP